MRLTRNQAKVSFLGQRKQEKKSVEASNERFCERIFFIIYNVGQA